MNFDLPNIHIKFNTKILAQTQLLTEVKRTTFPSLTFADCPAMQQPQKTNQSKPPERRVATYPFASSLLETSVWFRDQPCSLPLSASVVVPSATRQARHRSSEPVCGESKARTHCAAFAKHLHFKFFFSSFLFATARLHKNDVGLQIAHATDAPDSQAKSQFRH